ncbi:MAG: glycoside hydrolase family 13 protein [Kosmotoga sp.]|uniref:cyclomaltodextrinase n=1 Tax=Kosmotoga sp. TaxID=1955248 RepID=UPI0025BD7E14|nr:cyclomaltodextrinase [Kosmotoga sp.]MCD6160703.1 glycoside hydrolase family 13 protein [Kosmotoga sp.]
MDNWKMGIIYQIFPDRFKIGCNNTVFKKAKSGLYSLPGQVPVNWCTKPRRSKDGSHQYLFWGGDLRGIVEELDHIKSLGTGIIYLTPIFFARSNHKYDTIDYFQIDPAFGTLEDFRLLCDKAHSMGIKVVLDGVFNHVGDASKWFNKHKIFGKDMGAYNKPESEFRDFFYFNDNGYRGWMNAETLPELNLENKKLQEILFTGENSVIKYWLKQGADGWRLDCAFDLGYEFNQMVANEARKVKNDALIIGEVWNYPKGWNVHSGLDGLMNYFFRTVIFDLLRGDLKPAIAAEIIEKSVKDCGIDYLNTCWNILSSHDVPRLSSELKDERDIQLAIALQFTLPGVPMIYYGEELEMIGGVDPENRGAMEWEKINERPSRLEFYTKMGKIWNDHKAIREGNFEIQQTSNVELFAFKRSTDLIDELMVIIFNFTEKEQFTSVYINEGLLMNGTPMIDIISNERFNTFTGKLEVKVPGRSFLILTPEISRTREFYTPYKRV